MTLTMLPIPITGIHQDITESMYVCVCVEKRRQSNLWQAGLQAGLVTTLDYHGGSTTQSCIGNCPY